MSEAADELTVHLANRLEEIERLAAVIEAFTAKHQLPDAIAFAFNLLLERFITGFTMGAVKG